MAGIRRIVVVLVHRNGQHRRIFQERMLLTVTEGHIPINDGDTLAAIHQLCTLSHQYVVGEHTESTRPVLLGMMARWPDQAVDISDLPFHHGVEAFQGAAGRQQGYLVAASADW